MESDDTSKDEQFKKCVRKGRRGACTEIVVETDKLQQIIETIGITSIGGDEQVDKSKESKKNT